MLRRKLFVNRIVLAEMAWVLRRRLRLARTEVAAVVDGLIAAIGVDIEDEPVVRDALNSFRRGPGDFADHLVGAVNAASSCRTTYTFDRAASKTGYFSPLPATNG
jgi:predicted nucleic-acid-binding protein